MNKPNKMTVKLGVVALVLAMSILTGCALSDLSNLPTVCHATGDPTNPYEEIALNSADLVEHRGHPNDIISQLESGCPTNQVEIIDGEIAICHATGDETNPYDEITVSVDGLDGHGDHEGDIVPAPEGGCPTSPLVISDGKITICHATGSETNPFDEITVSVNGLNGHDKHEGDIIPVPDGGCSTIPVEVSDGKITICHATGSETNPFDEITVSVNGLNGHAKHKGDFIPMPEDGCPISLVEVSDGKITICHATGSETNPFDEITVSVNGLNGHGKHEGDIIPVPEEGCPTSPEEEVNNAKTTICHATGDETNPYDEITASVNGLNGHDQHEGDINPVPESGCPTSPVEVSDNKVTICHATSSKTNPYNEITVSVNGLDGHGKHEGDIIPMPEVGCPTSPLVISDGKITICHATGSKTNPFDEITVSVNGLNGHGKHEGDFIPVPVGGCPTTNSVEVNEGKITICHATSSKKNPYNLIIVSVNGLNGHGKHEGDIIPAPGGVCP